MKTKDSVKCSVPNCKADADYAVIFYDVYPYRNVAIFYEAHNLVPFICQKHMEENEHGAKTEYEEKNVRAYRGHVTYPHTPSHGQGFVIYRPLNGK